jgi:hypothetical protein
LLMPLFLAAARPWQCASTSAGRDLRQGTDRLRAVYQAATERTERGRMRRLLGSAALILVALSLQAPPAQAKGRVEICGARGCTLLYGMDAKPAVDVLTQGGRERVSPSAPAPFFTIHFAVQPESPLAYWIPTAGLLRVGWERAIWIRPTKAETRRLRAKTRGLRPLPAPKSVSVAVNLKPVRGDPSYLRLYTLGHVTRETVEHGGWLKISFFGRSSPWTDGKNSLWISRRGAFLRRDGEIIAVPATVAARVRARLPLTDA